MALIQDPQMPKYRCHKVVSALRIYDVVRYPAESNGGATLFPHDDRFKPIEVSKAWMDKHQPKPENEGLETRGYYVVYEDGYASWSPIKVFEDGYVSVENADSCIIHAAARATHEANRILCESQGDNSQVPWEQAPDWQKNAAIIGAGLIKNDPSTTPEQSHQSWLRVKEVGGWKYGLVKDPEKKEHPCFIPYNQLPANQRLKDELFGIVVRAVLGL